MLKEYNCFVLRFRGDGRRYELDVHGNRVWENSNSMWTTSIYTKVYRVFRLIGKSGQKSTNSQIFGFRLIGNNNTNIVSY